MKAEGQGGTLLFLFLFRLGKGESNRCQKGSRLLTYSICSLTQRPCLNKIPTTRKNSSVWTSLSRPRLKTVTTLINTSNSSAVNCPEDRRNAWNSTWNVRYHCRFIGKRDRSAKRALVYRFTNVLWNAETWIFLCFAYGSHKDAYGVSTSVKNKYYAFPIVLVPRSKKLHCRRDFVSPILYSNYPKSLHLTRCSSLFCIGKWKRRLIDAWGYEKLFQSRFDPEKPRRKLKNDDAESLHLSLCCCFKQQRSLHFKSYLLLLIINPPVDE